MASLTHEDSEEDPLAEYAWVYDAAGQLIQWTDHGVVHDYGYDAQVQLISDDDGVDEQEYEWDIGRVALFWVACLHGVFGG